MLHSTVLDLPPEPFELARRLADARSPVVLWARGGSVAYLACDPLATSQALDPEPTLPLASTAMDGGVPRWIGVIPYEARRTLERAHSAERRPAPELCEPHWLRFGAVAEVSNQVRVIGDDSAAVRELSARLLRAPGPRRDPEVEPGAFEPDALHLARIERALEHIRRGDLYQVNLARPFEFRVRGEPSEILRALTPRGRPPYSAAFRLPGLDLVMASPELCLSLDTSGTLLTSPIKGTRPRGATPVQDRALLEELDQDAKERAELTMILDVERNDLGRAAEVGSVRLVHAPHVETHATVHHRVATLGARLRRGMSRQQLLECMLPSGSVTGAPKVRAMELIAELESARRGLYTGVFGSLAHDGGFELGMAIRTLTVCEGRARYFAGGGIVADSVPEREVEETRWKAEALLAWIAGR